MLEVERNVDQIPAKQTWFNNYPLSSAIYFPISEPITFSRKKTNQIYIKMADVHPHVVQPQLKFLVKYFNFLYQMPNLRLSLVLFRL